MKHIHLILTASLLVNLADALNTAPTNQFNLTDYLRELHSRTRIPVANKGHAYGADYPLATSLAQTNSAKFATNKQNDTSLPQPHDPMAGVGYSSDGGIMAPSICFNVESLNKGAQKSNLSVNETLTSQQLASDFGIDLSLSGSYSGFSAGDSFSYLKNHEETDTSYSINYMHKIYYQNVAYYALNSKLLLNSTGKTIYNNGNNPSFRLFCGDHLVDSWINGAEVIATLKFNFKNISDKETFKHSFAAGYVGIAQVANTITSVAARNNINVAVNIDAYQIGGDPTKYNGRVNLHNNFIINQI
jgi:hypothetical protein